MVKLMRSAKLGREAKRAFFSAILAVSGAV